MTNSLDVELQEAERLARLGFYDRARKILEPYHEYQRVPNLLVVIDQLEVDFDKKRTTYKFDYQSLIVAIVFFALSFFMCIINLYGYVYGCLWIIGEIMLFIASLWFFKQALTS